MENKKKYVYFCTTLSLGYITQHYHKSNHKKLCPNNSIRYRCSSFLALDRFNKAVFNQE